MKKNLCYLFLLMCACAASCSAPQNDENNLFEWSHGKVVSKPELVNLSPWDDGKWIDSLGFKVIDFKVYPLSSQNNKYHCTVRIEGMQQKVGEDYFEQLTILDSKGNVLFSKYDEMFGTTQFLTGNWNSDHFFEKVDLDDNSYALFFGTWNFGCCPQDPGDMIIIVVSKNKATPVYRGPAYAITPTDFNSENFSIDYVDDARGLYNDEEGFIFTPERLARHTVYRIYKEGNMLKRTIIEAQSAHNGYEYVDLGLSVKWAAFNVGAKDPEGYGDYFAWGETEQHYEWGYAQEEPQSHWNFGKSAGYTWSTYKWSKDTYSTLTKYCNKGDYGNDGFIDNLTELIPDNDAAHVFWGGNWRIPTHKEIEELFNECTWTWTEINGIAGYRVTSKVSGYTDRSIFLPAAGGRGGKDLNGIDYNGRYWSSSLDTDNPLMAWSISFVNGDLENIDDDVSVTPFSRHNGQSVRPVCPR